MKTAAMATTEQNRSERAIRQKLRSAAHTAIAAFFVVGPATLMLGWWPAAAFTGCVVTVLGTLYWVRDMVRAELCEE